MTIRLRLFSGFAILIVIFVAGFVVNQRLSDTVIRNSEYINTSEAIIRNANVLHKRMIDMQSGYRGYLLSGQADFLDTYNEGLKTIPPLVKEQRALLTSTLQVERLDSILFLHQSWVDYANSLISAKQDPRDTARERYRDLFEKKLKSFVGKRINDEIRKIFLNFEAYEYTIRKERRERLAESIEQTRNINLALNIFSIALATVSGFYIVRIITRRISLMVNLAEEISRGNFRQIADNKRDELRRLSESLNTMSAILARNFDELTRKNRELDQFAYVVSHDLKAPLRGIDNITRWMEEDHSQDLSPDIRRNLDLIKGRTKRLENMINGLLEYARIGRVKKETEQVDVGMLLGDLVELLVPPGFEVVIRANMPVLQTARIRIEQVFSNLISNAVKYNDKPQGRIEIRCRDLGALYEFEVQDNGVGIQAEYFDKIFVIFQTLKERDAFESTGVGLAIVKRIIEEQGTRISVRSEVGKGTTFSFTWHKN